MASSWQLLVLVLRPCGPATEPKNPRTPENTKKNTKSPTLGWPPKIRKKYRKKYKNDPKTAIFVSFLYFFGIFFVFSGANPGWGISFFFRILGVLGFLGSVAGLQGHNSCLVFISTAFILTLVCLYSLSSTFRSKLQGRHKRGAVV